jgi:hypothetical protein
MLCTRLCLFSQFILVIMYVGFLADSDVRPQPTPRQSSAQSASDASADFPHGSTFGMTLHYLEEPSLREAAKDPSVRAFRVTYFSTEPVHMVAVRLVIHPDGSGLVTRGVSSGANTDLKRTEKIVSISYVVRLLEMVDRAGFWTSAASEGFDQKTDSAGHRTFVLDGSWWLLEGVQNGSYHRAARRNSTPGALTDIGCYLAKEPTGPDDSPAPMTGCTSYHP